MTTNSAATPPISPESLVQELLPQITLQTAQLPTLHTQLGLASSALEQDLEILRKALIKTVEDVVHTRQKEVQEWADRCDKLEDSCIRLSTALGPSAKSLGATVGELRKQLVYPRRFELLTEQEDKLLRLYASKLEQLHTLTARLVALAETLGKHFYSSEVLKPAPASGQKEHADSWRNVTPERFNWLEKELTRGRAEVTRRLGELARTMESISWLCDELGIPLPNPLSPVPSMEELPYPRARTEPVKDPSDPFVDVALPDPQRQREEYYPIFARFVARLQEAEDEELDGDLIGVEKVEPSLMLMDWFERLLTDLEDEKSRREAHIQTIFDQLDVLWKRLGISDEDIDEFIELNRGSTLQTIRAYENELEHMQQVKREKMSIFIMSAREEIERLWEDLMYGDVEREAFTAFYDGAHTEDLLTIHEEQIAKLKEERKTKATILVAVRKYFQILEEQKELEASANDQTRLLGRGNRGDPGRLLREEKMRKRVTKEKPKLEAQLLKEVPAWEAENGRQFLVHSETFLQLLEETLHAEEAQRENRKRPRPPSVVGRATTPAPPVSTRSKGATTPGLRTVSGSLKAPASLGPAKKKQKLNDSSAKPALSQVNTPAVLSSTVGKLSRSTSTASARGARRSARVAAATALTPSVCAPTPSVYVHQDSRPTGAAPKVVPQYTARARLPLTVLGANTPPRVFKGLPRSEKDNSSSPVKLTIIGLQPKERGLLFPSRPLPSVPISTAGTPRAPSSLRNAALFTKKETVPPPVYGMMAMTAAAVGDAPKQRRGERRESFRPRPSNAGLDLPEFWREKCSIRNEAVAELEEVSDSDS